MKVIKNKNGFTLIELLAVIVILGLLMAIAIPSVTRYITQSRKKTLIKTVDSYTNAIINSVNNAEFGPISNGEKLYYIPIECVTLEKGGADPFGDWQEAYVVVGYRSDIYSYDYYFTFYDSAGYGMKLTKTDKITPSSLENPTTVTADTIKGQTIDGKKVMVLDNNSCNSSSATEYVAGSGSEEPETGYVYYYYDPSTYSMVETSTKANWDSWARKKLSTGQVEFCAKFSGGDACIEVNMNYGGSQHKLQDKTAYLESKGATCEVMDNGENDSYGCYEPGHQGFYSHFSDWGGGPIYMIYFTNEYCDAWYEVEDGQIHCN